MAIGQNWRMMGKKKYYDTAISRKADLLSEYATETDKLFGTMGFGPAGDFLTNIMGQESLYGHLYDPTAMHTMTMAQIDPIRYAELLEDIQLYPGWANKAKIINDYMQSKPGYADWDITQLADVGYQPLPSTADGPQGQYVYNSISPHTQDPLTAFLVSRLMLTKDPDVIPVTDQEQANKWDSFWNRNPDPKTSPNEFIDKLPYRTVNNVMNDYNKTNLTP